MKIESITLLDKNIYTVGAEVYGERIDSIVLQEKSGLSYFRVNYGPTPESERERRVICIPVSQVKEFSLEPSEDNWM